MAAPLKYDYYKILGLPRDASQQDIKRAYRKLVMKYHPDRNSSTEAALVFVLITEAYEILSDQETRKRYDERLRNYMPSTIRPLRTPTRRAAVRSNNTGKASPLFAVLHLVGIAFAVMIAIRAIVGVAVQDWPLLFLFLILPSIVLVPDGIKGFKSALRSWSWI